MKLTTKQLNAVKESGLLTAEPNTLTEDDLYDSGYDALLNEAPTIEQFTAEQSKGEYPVVIRGVPGAYFVQALEYDDIGVFDNIEQARDALFSQYWEFLKD